jgi:hypothetical protein
MIFKGLNLYPRSDTGSVSVIHNRSFGPLKTLDRACILARSSNDSITVWAW